MRLSVATPEQTGHDGSPPVHAHSGEVSLRELGPLLTGGGHRAKMASAPAQQPTLTVEQARVVLSEVIQAFSVPENSARMEEARESACNDMGKMLQLVLPVATQIQQEVIKAYGFNNDGEGVLKFARLVKMYETQDPEIAAMSVKLKSLLLPPLSTPPIGGGIPAS
ncbi:hypothetical protein ACEWY4_022187 [Coilia grayii]|uniref:Protein C10 n=1 Tax=Coilia grayii TaxID=363190 RepID=A0ABD1J5B1_9TELE